MVKTFPVDQIIPHLLSLFFIYADSSTPMILYVLRKLGAMELSGLVTLSYPEVGVLLTVDGAGKHGLRGRCNINATNVSTIKFMERNPAKRSRGTCHFVIDQLHQE